MSTVKFPDATAVTLPPGHTWNGADDEVSITEWDAPDSGSHSPQPPRAIDIHWYEQQRIRLRANESQAAKVNETLALGWYKIIKRSLADLPIQKGGRSIANPQYGAGIRAIATALAMSPRTLSNYRSAVSHIRDEAHFRELIQGSTWAHLVFALGRSSAHHVNGDGERAGSGVLPLVKRRFVVQVPTQTADFLMENGLEIPDVTAIVVSYLRQPRVQKDLLKLFRASAASQTAREAAS